MAKKTSISAKVTKFLDSVSELFAEQSNGGWQTTVDFKLLRGQVVGFLDSCSEKGVSKARAEHGFNLPNGRIPKTNLERPPAWMKISASDRQELVKTAKTKSFVKALSRILRRQEKQNQMVLDTQFETLPPESKSSKRSRGKKPDSEEEDYEPPQAKKSKSHKAAQKVPLAAPTTRRTVPKKKDDAQDASVKKSNNTKTQTTLRLKVKRNPNINNDNVAKQSTIPKAEDIGDNKLEASSVPAGGNSITSPHQTSNRPQRSGSGADSENIPSATSSATRPSIDESRLPQRSDENIARVFEEFQAGESLRDHGLLKSPKAEEGVKPSVMGVKDKYQHDKLDLSLMPLSQPIESTQTPPQSSDQTTKTPQIDVNGGEEPKNDSDIDTDGESDDDSRGNTSTSASADRSTTNEATDFWTSAPKTVKPRVISWLQADDPSSRSKVESPLQRLRTSFEIYKSRISHIPTKTWLQYKKNLENFVQSTKFSTMSFMARFGKFRRIIFVDEELEAMRTEDWERTRKAAQLCGLLAEVTAPEGEDAKWLAERMVSVNIRDIDWLEKTIGTRKAVNATEDGDTMEGVEMSGALQA